MKGNMTDERLMSFLYGEVNAEERKAVEDYLRNNPDKQKELEELGNMRSILGRWQDHEEVEKPDLSRAFYSEGDPYNLWRRLAIAASVALFMALGWISYKDLINPDNDQEFMIAREQLDKLLQHQEKIASHNDKLLNRIAELERQIGDISEEQRSLQATLASAKAPEINKKELVREYMVAMQQQNKQVMDEYFETMSLQQRQYLQTVLADFGSYMIEQRRQDMQILQARIMDLEHNTGEFQNATAQLMANLTNTEIQFDNQ